MLIEPKLNLWVRILLAVKSSYYSIIIFSVLKKAMLNTFDIRFVKTVYKY